MTFLAKDNLKSLNQLVHLATSIAAKTPHLRYEDVNNAEGVIKIAGERAQLELLDPSDKDLYMALSPALPKGLYTQAVERKFKFIACSENYYPLAKDKEIYRVALGKRSNTQSYPMYILSDDEWDKSIRIASDLHKSKAITNRKKVFAKCNAKLLPAELLTPRKNRTLRELCLDGAERLGINLTDPIYGDRLDRELDLIEEKKFEDYFFIIADLVCYAKTKMIVGPARGSSCGSLVCYLLNITAVDPIPYGLIFERFIDTTRADLPDIDIDFSDARRFEAFKYAEEKYGKDHVARLGTVTLFKPTSALNQAGASLRVPKWMVTKVSDTIVERSLGDARAWQTIEDTLESTDAGRLMIKDFPSMKLAQQMEGHPNSSSQHAAGLLLTQSPILDHVAVHGQTNVAMCDKYDAESLNMLKIDALGLTQLSIFERTLELIGEKSVNGYLEKLPLDDPLAFKILNDFKFAGIFQFNGIALQNLVKQVRDINHLDDIIAITALARPGPLATGGANLWCKRRTGREPILYNHPIVEPYLKETLGIVIYQEQVLTMGREIGDLSWAQVTALRKAMSKSLGVEYFNQFGDPWKIGAMKRGMSQGVADKMWDDLCSMGSWAFNKAHAVAYGLVSYYCCYLKAHYPLEFAAATLDAESEPDRQIQLLREMKGEGIDYVDVDPDHSGKLWSIANNKLIGPLTSIKGIGPAFVNEIINARKKGIPLRPTIANRLKEAKTDIKTLYPVKAFIERNYPDLESINIVSKVHNLIDIQCGKFGRFEPILAIAIAVRINPRDENEEVNIRRRGGEVVTGPTKYLNMFFRDDTDEIFVKVDRKDFEQYAVPIIERGRPGKAIYAIKGTVPPNFRMISVDRIKYLGDIDQ
jgi:DNA-directed DNA polymerase III PolC